MTRPAVEETLPAGMCVCGRPIPVVSPSDWACGELCQKAWLLHHADPTYPHPRIIREGADAAIAARMGHTPPPAGRPVHGGYPPGALPVPDGAEIDVDGVGYARIGGRWQPTGPWQPLTSDLADAVAYRRWCPHCRVRQPSTIETDPAGAAQTTVQVCSGCVRAWPGRALVGVVETRGGPWPAIRLRISDGYRSVTHTVSEDALARRRGAGPAVGWLTRHWIRMERDLLGGYTDGDQPTARQMGAALRRTRKTWDWAGIPPLADRDGGGL